MKEFTLAESDLPFNFFDEVDESTGTWGYIKFEVDDITQARVKLEREAKMLLKELMIDF